MIAEGVNSRYLSFFSRSRSHQAYIIYPITFEPVQYLARRKNSHPRGDLIVETFFFPLNVSISFRENESVCVCVLLSIKKWQPRFAVFVFESFILVSFQMESIWVNIGFDYMDGISKAKKKPKASDANRTELSLTSKWNGTAESKANHNSCVPGIFTVSLLIIVKTYEKS